MLQRICGMRRTRGRTMTGQVCQPSINLGMRNGQRNCSAASLLKVSAQRRHRFTCDCHCRCNFPPVDSGGQTASARGKIYRFRPPSEGLLQCFREELCGSSFSAGKQGERAQAALRTTQTPHTAQWLARGGRHTLHVLHTQQQLSDLCSCV